MNNCDDTASGKPTILAMFENGFDTFEIARALRISESAAYNRLYIERSKALGLPAKVGRAPVKPFRRYGAT